MKDKSTLEAAHHNSLEEGAADDLATLLVPYPVVEEVDDHKKGAIDRMWGFHPALPCYYP